MEAGRVNLRASDRRLDLARMDDWCEIFITGPLSADQRAALGRRGGVRLVEIAGKAHAVSTARVSLPGATRELRSYRVYLANDFVRETHYGKITESRFDTGERAFVACNDEPIFGEGCVQGVEIEEVAEEYLRDYLEENEARSDREPIVADAEDRRAIDLIATLVEGKHVELVSVARLAEIAVPVATILADESDDETRSERIYEALLGSNAVAEVFCDVAQVREALAARR